MLSNIEKIISIPKSFYVSGRLVSWTAAFKLPIFVRYNCILRNLSGTVKFSSPLKSRMLKVGFGYVGIYDKRFSRSILEIAGTIIVEGYAGFGHGAKISVGPQGILTIGDSFTNTAEGKFVCFNRMTFGRNVGVGWDVLIMDTDFHPTENTKTGDIYSEMGEVFLGDDVWVGTRAVILKDTYIPDGCILGANSTACKKYEEPNALIAGAPASVRKNNITKAK